MRKVGSRHFNSLKTKTVKSQASMKTLLITICCILSIVSIGSVVTSLNSSHVTTTLRQQMKRQAADNKARLDELHESETTSEQTISLLQSNLGRLKRELADAKSALESANGRISGYELADRNRSDARVRYLQQVPPPKDMQGKKFFEKVVGAEGGTLMENAFFIQLNGRRLVFRAGSLDGEARSFDMDNLHPLMLEHLSINREAVIVGQKEMLAKAQVQEKARQAQALLDLQAWTIQQQANAKIELENKKAAADEAARQASLETERIKANAAMVEAQKKPMQINTTVIQQQKQVQVGY